MAPRYLVKHPRRTCEGPFWKDSDLNPWAPREVHYPQCGWALPDQLMASVGKDWGPRKRILSADHLQTRTAALAWAALPPADLGLAGLQWCQPGSYPSLALMGIFCVTSCWFCWPALGATGAFQSPHPPPALAPCTSPGQALCMLVFKCQSPDPQRPH